MPGLGHIAADTDGDANGAESSSLVWVAIVTVIRLVAFVNQSREAEDEGDGDGDDGTNTCRLIVSPYVSTNVVLPCGSEVDVDGEGDEGAACVN